jgi:hypothetical protein
MENPYALGRDIGPDSLFMVVMIFVAIAARFCEFPNAARCPRMKLSCGCEDPQMGLCTATGLTTPFEVFFCLLPMFLVHDFFVPNAAPFCQPLKQD